MIWLAWDHWGFPLTELGRQQAYASREWLGRYSLDHNTTDTKTRFWVSPYVRTRQTTDEVIHGIEAVASTFDDIYRRKIEFDRIGLFDGIPEEQLPHISQMRPRTTTSRLSSR